MKSFVSYTDEGNLDPRKVIVVASANVLLFVPGSVFEVVSTLNLPESSYVFLTPAHRLDRIDFGLGHLRHSNRSVVCVKEHYINAESLVLTQK